MAPARSIFSTVPVIGVGPSKWCPYLVALTRCSTASRYQSSPRASYYPRTGLDDRTRQPDGVHLFSAQESARLPSALPRNRTSLSIRSRLYRPACVPALKAGRQFSVRPIEGPLPRTDFRGAGVARSKGGKTVMTTLLGCPMGFQPI